MSTLSDLLSNLASGGTGTPNSAIAAVPQTPSYVPQDAITQQYGLANQLRKVAPATSWAGVLAQGLGAIGGNLVQGDANNALSANQALRTQDIKNVSNATDDASLQKALIGAQTPDVQTLGLKTKIDSITNDPNKEYRVRAAQALQTGLQRGTREFNDFVLTGKMPDVDSPMSVKEWNYFKALPPDQQQQYLTMKRAEKYLDTGTEFVRPNPVVPGQNISAVPKNVAGEASQKEVGQAQGKAVVNLPIVNNAADRMLSQIDELMTDPGLDKITGTLNGRTPNISSGSVDAQSRLDQIKGGIFLQAYNDLRGAGQISNAEGESAKAAYARLNNQTMGTPQYRQALQELRDQIVRLRDIATARANGGNVTGAGSLPPGYSIEKVQ